MKGHPREWLLLRFSFFKASCPSSFTVLEFRDLFLISLISFNRLGIDITWLSPLAFSPSGDVDASGALDPVEFLLFFCCT